jgi:hypothetical protein
MPKKVMRSTIALVPQKEGLKNVKVIYTLPSYLHLINGSLNKSADSISPNNDSLNQNLDTTTIVWDISELNESWTVTFNVTFEGRLPAGISGSPPPMSVVNYTTATNSNGQLDIPEGEIRLASGKQVTRNVSGVPKAITVKTAPGFEAIYNLLAIAFAVFSLRW